ncbi:MAG TPA: hypothetical protein VHV55_03295 [Pirellulales bacterium]|jgi:tetratricopeptide (TPR) repeat protein|nr:hypothetical protein [Pirellulales bacterium]
MDNPWELVQSKQYEAAVSEYSRLYQETGTKLDLHNRGLAYLLVKNYEAGLADFQHSIRSGDPRHRSGFEYTYAGIAFWCTNRTNEAVSMWRAGLSAPYTDAAGGVEIPALLLYAGCRLKDQALRKEAMQLLKKLWSKHLRRQKKKQDRSGPTHNDLVHPGLVAWPGAIVPFLLGEIDQAQLRLLVEHAGNEILKQRWQCAADFYVGLRAACEGDLPGFRDNMKSCAERQRCELEHESYLARWEVDAGYCGPAGDTSTG